MNTFKIKYINETKRYVLLVFIMVATSIQTIAQQIYLSPGGSDTNPGTKNSPLKSLTTARDQARILRKSQTSPQSIEIIIAPGKYYMKECLVLSKEDSGTKNAPLIIRSLNNEKPIFYGGISLPKFSAQTDGLWKTQIPSQGNEKIKIEQIYTNNIRAIRAEEPDSGFFQSGFVSEQVLVKGKGPFADSAIQTVKLDPASMKWFKDLQGENIKDVVIRFYHKWDNTIKPVASYNQVDSTVTIAGTGMKPWNPINNKSQFIIENIKSGLDSPGEWFAEESGTLYYKPRLGETIENTQVIVPTLEKLITITGSDNTNRVENIRFENISFQIAAYHLPPNGAEPSQAAASVPASIQVNFAESITFKNCEIAHTGGSGISFGRACSNSLIQNCNLYDLGAGAIKIGETVTRQDSSEITHHIKVDNNILTDGGNVFPCAVALAIFHGRDNTISHNEISNFKYTGISVGWVWGYKPSPSKRNIIEFNNIHHLGWGVLSDMGGIYTLGASEGTMIRNNNINNVYSNDYGGWGIYTDEGSSGILIENNLVYNCKSAGFHQHYGKDNIIRNNIFADNLKSQLQATKVEKHLSFTFKNNIIFYKTGTLLSSNWAKIDMDSDSNCYWDGRGQTPVFDKTAFDDWQKSGKDLHSVIADPAFVNASQFDFRFKSLKTAQQIGFKPFDYTQAGVYGSSTWKRVAQLPVQLRSSFSKTVKDHERQSVVRGNQ